MQAVNAHGSERRARTCKCALCMVKRADIARKQRERRERYRGTCGVCGAPTDGSSGYNAPRYCVHHEPRAAVRARRGTGPMQQQALMFCMHVRSYSEIRDALGITSNHTSALLGRLVRYRLLDRLGRGLYRTAL